MRFLKLTILALCLLVVLADKDGKKGRDKRQHPRRSGRPPPYAVQMEPIAHYSQRDPLYNPLADAKSDEAGSYYEDSPYNYYPTEPEPIIEIIIKESNESLPTPAPPPQPPKPKKEPIQVFYVKYEKKQGYGEDKPRVVYDTPIPALTPVEEHEEIRPESPAEEYGLAESQEAVSPSPPEPSTTLRAIIRPDSEVYHADTSGLRVTFGTDQVPPNNHNKRSDGKDGPNEVIPGKPTALPAPGSSKRPHGPYAPLQPIPARGSPAFPQQRVVNSAFSQPQQQFLGPPAAIQQQQQQGPPPNFGLQPQFHQQVPPHVRTQYQFNPNQRPAQAHRPAITIQGLPELQQRLPFNSFAAPHRLSISLPQSNIHLPSLPQQQQLPPTQNAATNFLFDPHRQQYKEQQQRQQEKQRVLEQRQQEQKRFQEQQQQLSLLEQRRKQEEQQKYQAQQNYQQQNQQQQHYHQQQQYHQQHFNKFGPTIQLQQQQQQQQQAPRKQLAGEILKAIPKLEQHYAIRENPLHPGPFPPNPQFAEIPQTSFGSTLTNDKRISLQQSNLIQQSHQQQIPLQQPQAQALNYNKFGNSILKQVQPSQQQSSYQSQQQFFTQNLPTAQEQRLADISQPSIWGRAVFQSKSFSPNDDLMKIYATPVTKAEDDGRKYASTPNSIRYQPTTTRPTYQLTRITAKPLTTTSRAPPPPTTTTTTTTTMRTQSPRNEAKIKENIANLPDEVPDDIREQLLSSGILGNADIQILDYDKVGGINIGDLPAEALANFYGAGGAAATSASEPVPQVAKRPKSVEQDAAELQTASASSSAFNSRNSIAQHFESEVRMEEVTLRPGGVEMKVVRFDPNTAQGQNIAERHIQENATRLSPVAVQHNTDVGQYNRYLPLKVSGASFPIPNEPELNGKKISSVVVLAPVDYNNEEQSARQSRKIANDVQAIRFLAGESLKQLVKKPSADNYKRWLDHERKTEPQRQSVVLLVTTRKDSGQGEKEIFMYDVSSESVSKLAGDLSTAFVDAAESNSDADEDPMNISATR